MPRSSLACSGLRTMLTRPMPSSRQILFSIWPRFEAAAVWTSALWPSRFMVSIMPSAVSGLTNHEAPSAARRAGRQRLAVGRLQQAILRIHRAAHHRHRLAQQRLRRLGRARLDHRARALVADRHGLVEPGRQAGQRCGRHLRRDLDAVAAARGLGRRHVGRPQQQAEVRRIDRRRLDLDQDLVRPGLGRSTLASDNSSSPLLLISERSCSPVVLLASLIRNLPLIDA